MKDVVAVLVRYAGANLPDLVMDLQATDSARGNREFMSTLKRIQRTAGIPDPPPTERGELLKMMIKEQA